MAAYTSTQTGLWNDSATWGGAGYPDTADDTVTVNHKVTYNITDSGSPFLGDITIANAGNGHLVHQTGTYLNMNGVLSVNGGIYQMADDVVLAFTGDNSADHGVNVGTADYTTFLARGSTRVAETNMSTSGSAGDYYIPVNDASDFATGDWISVFFRYTDLKSDDDFINEVNYPSGVLQADGELNTGQYSGDAFTSNNDRLHNEAGYIVDEGFVIHDISSNNIYPRDLIGPDATITSASTSYIIVDDADVFRVNQKIIFGTGSSRTSSKITDIDYSKNKISLEDNLTSQSVVGQKVYLTALKIHKYKNCVVRTVGNMVVNETAASSTTITLSNVGDYSVGDKFYVEHEVRDSSDWDTVMPNNENSWYQAIQIRHEITGISGDTLTFSPALPYKVYAGSFAYKANRPITIKGASDDPTDGTCKPYFYVQSNTTQRTIGNMSRYRRKFIVKDLQFLGVGNSSSTYQWFWRVGGNDGYWRYSKSMEGVVLDAMGNSDNNYGFRNDQNAYTCYRNCISVNAYRAIYSGREYTSWTNGVVMSSRRGGESVNFSSGYFAYARHTRIFEYDDIYVRSQNQQFPYQWLTQTERYLRLFRTRSMPNQCDFSWRYYIYDWSPQCTPIYCKFNHLPDSLDYRTRYKTLSYNLRLSYYTPMIYGETYLQDVDYKINNDVMLAGCWVEYDKSERAYYCVGGGGADYSNPIGMFQTTMLRPGETLKVKIQVKIHEDNPNSSWTYRPKFVYAAEGLKPKYLGTAYGSIKYLEGTGRDNQQYDFDYVGDVDSFQDGMYFPKINYGNVGEFNYDDSNHPEFYGTAERDPFTSKTEYISKTYSITNDSGFNRRFSYGVGIVNTLGGYGYYLKPLITSVSKRRGLFGNLFDQSFRYIINIVKFGTVAEKIKNRIGGARL